MRFPIESLDDFRATARKKAEPPAPVSLEFTGEVEVLKPLARWEGPIRPEVAAGEPLFRRALSQLSWFHRSLAMAGALTIFTFLLGTGLYLAVYGPPEEPVSPDDLAMDRPADDALLPADEPDTSTSLFNEDFPFTNDELNAVRPVAGPRRIRPRAVRTAYRRRNFLPVPQFVVSEFVPTTLVIFVENGEIKTRIEPQASFKKPLTLPN